MIFERFRARFGVEILDHQKKSIRLDRLKNGGPLLLEHCPDDIIGVVERVDIGPDRVGRAVVRFGKNAAAEEAARVAAEKVIAENRKAAPAPSAPAAPATAPASDQQVPPPATAPTADPFADDYAALAGKTVTTEDGRTVDAAQALREFDQRQKTLADLKTCLGRKS